MFLKGIVFLLIWLLFISRFIPKYFIFRDTNQVHLFGKVWEGELGFLALLMIVVIAIILLALSIRNFYLYFSNSKKRQER